ncbi:TPA: 4-hydroxythreonine-4-phosphate dehydrogenase PdxA [Candidatus Delongbacteria bacterium]|nr:MAG: 4-hydroxythreonine-4-phosphate dehydrogenase PdxA [Candidatus Delongbacteria bacterium GWF2_40_14]HAQ62521.1 4-hydroxythreonine-4-phosphate dehydrogenase PdxA [Candidatus Delongbacteria bacterium]
MEKIFITVGDINGIGNELILKFIDSGIYPTNNSYIIIGCRRIFDETASILNYPTECVKNINASEIENIAPGFYFYDIPSPDLRLELGKATAEAGLLSGLAIKKGVELSDKYKGALVTAPINKYSLHLGGFDYPGHTEFIAELLSTDDFLMILDGKKIKVALVTTHLALKDVSHALNITSIFNKGRLLYSSLVSDYGIKEPRIAVCSLNPHAGDSGLFGNEEEKIISPAVEELNRKISRGKGSFNGPLPSDTAFTTTYLEKTDAHLVMYHDQGLIPLKLLSFGTAVNFTAGLKIVRTSPDHGTAYDIAGKGKADCKSFKNAVKMAENILENRKISLLRDI